MPKRYQIQTVKAEGKPTEILVHGPIGRSFWSDEGISGKEFTDALNDVPAGQKVIVGINSQGGSVGEGLAIFNAIQRRSADITARIDGYALSIASFFPLAAGKVVSPKASVWMIHNAWSGTEGNAKDHRKSADMLDTHDQTLVSAYMAKTGKSKNVIEAAMADETWMTGEEAVAYGLADEAGDNEPALDALDFSAARAGTFKHIGGFPAANSPLRLDVPRSILNLISAPKQGGAETHKPNMNKKMLALLKKHGVETKDLTDEQIEAAYDALIEKLSKPAAEPEKVVPLPVALAASDIEALRTQIANEKSKRITADVTKHVEAGRIAKDQAASWIKRAVLDETVLDDLAALPEARPEYGGLAVAGGARFEVGGKVARESINKHAAGKDRMKFLRDNWDQLIEAGVPLMPHMPVKNGLPVAANTIDTALTTAMLGSGVITVLQNRLPMLSACSLKWEVDRTKTMALIQVPIYLSGGTAQTNATSFEDTTNFVSTLDNVAITPARITAGAHLTAAELQTGRAMSDFALGKAHEIADAIQAKINAVLLTSIFSSPAAQSSATANFGHAELGNAWAAIAKSGRKYMILHQDAYKNFLPNNLFDFNVLSVGMPGWDGFLLNTYWTGATSGVYGFACAPQAIAIGAGLPTASPNRGLVVTATTVAVPDLGISVELQEWFATAGKVDWANWEIMFGAKEADTTAGVLIKTP